MADSLLVAGLVELLGGGQTLDSGPGQGAKIMLYTGYDLGAPVIDNDAVQSLLLDGERPYGERASNRTMTLPVLIHAPGRIKLLQAREQLLQLVDQEVWELQYTPDGFNPMVWTCFRATIDISKTSYKDEIQDYCIVELTFQAFPYGRSTDSQTIPIVQASGSQITPIIIDGYENANVGPGWFVDKTHKVQGTASIFTWSPSRIRVRRPFAPIDLSAMTGIRLWTTMAGPGQLREFDLVLFNNSKQYYVGPKVAQMRGNMAWQRIAWDLHPPADFDLSNVTGYIMDVSAGVYLDQLSAVPPWVQSAVTSRGSVVTVPGVLGTARAPVNLALTWASGTARSQFLVHRAPRLAPILYTPLVPYDNTAVLDGTAFAPAPTVDGMDAGPRWNGTHAVYACFTTFSGAGNRTVTITFRQAWNDAGIGGSTTATRQVSAVVDNSQPLVFLGTVDLPIVDTAKDNSATTWDMSVQSSTTADRVGEILVLDTRGETMFVSSARSAKNYWIDEPDTMGDPYDYVGKVVGGSSRSQALSVSGETAMPWRPFSMEPGDNQLLLHCPQEAPDCTVTLNPRWRTVRLV